MAPQVERSDRSVYAREWRATNRDRILARERKYTAEHKAETAARGKRWYAANKEHVKEWCFANALTIATRKRKYREAHKLTIAARKKEHYAANKATIMARGRRWADANKAKVAAYKKEWRATNRTALVLYMKAWRAAHIEEARRHSREWAKANPLRRRTYKATRRAQAKGNGGTHTAEDIYALYEVQHKRCAGCAKLLRGRYEIDHVIPLSKGGRNSVDNLQLLCGACNKSKSAMLPDQWAHRIGKLFV